MTAPIPTAWLLAQELEPLLDPELRGSIPDADAPWWIDRAQDRITESPQSRIPLELTDVQLDALKRAVVAWIEWRIDTGGTPGGIRIGQVTLPDTTATRSGETPLSGEVLSILQAAGLAARPVRGGGVVTRRAIPWRLLPHEHEWARYDGNTGDGDTWAPAVAVRCRFEPRTDTVIGVDGRTLTSVGLVFMNPHASGSPEAGDQWIVGSKAFRVLAVDTQVNIDGSVHHHEIKVG